MGDHMFNDLALSRDIMQDFLSKEETDHASRSLSVMVLQQSVWPFGARQNDADLPPSVGYPITLAAIYS
jgi:cullin-4